MKPSTVRIVFMGEKPLAAWCLERLLELPQVNVTAVCTRRPMQVWWGAQVVRSLAERRGIPIVKRSRVLSLEVDLILSVLYPFVVEAPVLARAARGAFNLHGAPLPRYRGCNGVSHAIINGDDRFGVTLHRMGSEVDGGPIVHVEWFPIDPMETAKDLYDRATEVSKEVWRQWLPRLLASEVPTYVPSADEPSFFHPRHSLADKEADLSWPAQKLWNFVRGMDFPPFPPAHATLSSGRRIELRAQSGDGPGPAGSGKSNPVRPRAQVGLA